jgi:hypothetical protein
MSKSIATLLLANTVPLIGVMFFDWSLLNILICFWAETAIIGAYTVAKILMARGSIMASVGAGKLLSAGLSQSGGPSRWFIALFFCVHFGIFMLGHGFFVLVIGGIGALVSGSVGFDTPDPWNTLSEQGFSLLLFLLVTSLSHGCSFVQNFLRGGEREKFGPPFFFMQPYSRVIVMHMAIMAGAFGTMLLGQPVIMLIALVALKIGMDLKLHQRSHARMQSVVS